MEGFDTLTMSYMTAAPMTLSNVTATDALSMPLLPLDNLDHHSNFDAETFAGYVCPGSPLSDGNVSATVDLP
jgi:hypothetical protein